MTKAEIVKQIAGQTGLESKMVAGVVEALLERIRAAQIGGQNVYFRGFGSFVRRERAAKKARDISRNTTVLVPAHTVPAFKPSKAFIESTSRNICFRRICSNRCIGHRWMKKPYPESFV